MRLVLALLLAAAPVSLGAGVSPAWAQTANAEARDPRLKAWFDAKYEEQLQMSPLSLTGLGRKERYGEIDDFSLAAADAQLAWQKATVDELKRSFDYGSLSPSDKLSYDIWVSNYEQAAAGRRFRDSNYVFTQMQGVHAALPSLLMSQHRVDTRQDMVDYISRVSGIGRAMSQLTEIARDRAANGVRPPYFAYDIATAEARRLSAGAPFDDGADNAIWADGKAKIAALAAKNAISSEDAAALTAYLAEALRDGYADGYKELIAFLEADRPNAAAVATGVGALKDGAAFYAQSLTSRTTTEMTPDEVHRLGLSEVKRIHKEMEAIQRKVGFKGDLKAFFEHVRTKPDNYFAQGDDGAKQYIAEADAAIRRIERQLPQYFGLLPKAALEVRRVEPFREQAGGAQHYRTGTPDGSRPGIYYAHLADMTAMPKNVLEAIAYHEALPGHHMQLSIAQELAGVPEFQKRAFYGSYIEGWGLYAEKLAKEMPGTYTDPYSDFGRLSNELWRAIRLVVDSGVHSKGWTEDQAIAYFSSNSATPLETVRNEVRRYIVWPGQATTYKVGELRILALRAEAEKALGKRFDIRGFHDAVLGAGSLPLTLLDRRVREWIAAEKAKS
ncbi:DUF885 domain-containing protein [Tsuneonella sp. HG249]